MIDIAAGKSTPRVLLDSDKKEFLIEGQSYPVNSNTFYDPIIQWAKEYFSTGHDEFFLKIKLLYINTSTMKALSCLFNILEDAFQNGKDIRIEWQYDRENEMAKETGEELLEDFLVPFSIVEQ